MPLLPMILGGVALLLVLALLFAFLRPGAPGAGSGEKQAGAAAQKGCSSPVPVKVSVTPAMRAVVADTAAEVSSQACATFEVAEQTPDVALADIKDPAKRPALWIADADVQIERARSQNQGVAMNASDVLYSSPLIVAMPKDKAPEGGKVTWTSVFDNPQALGMPDPETNSAGLLALFSAAAAGGDKPNPNPTTGPMGVALYQAATPDKVTLAQLPTKAPEWDAGTYVASEQYFTAYKAANAQSPLVAVAPEGGSVFLDYRAVSMPTTDAAVSSAVDVLEKALAGDAGKERATAAGFRAGDGAKGELATERMAQPSTDQVRAVLTQWQSISHGMRLIALVDTSGSMKVADGPSGASRIELAAGAAAMGLSALPANTDVGMWEFSTAPGKKGNWREVTPVAPLGDANSEHRKQLVAAAQAIPATVGGDTPLYDTLLDAVLTLQEDFDPKRMNLVILMTDGRNDAANSMNLSGLLKSLNKMTVPGEEVSVGAIAIGADADQEPLKKIAEVSDGAFFYAEKPEDIQQIITAALLDFAPTAKEGAPLP